MAVEFTTTSEEAVVNGVKILAYGPAGVGKTMQVATLPNPVLISAESGLLSLSRQNIERVFGAGREDITYNIPVLKVRDYTDLNEAYEWATLSPEADQYETIALDSITEIMEQILTAANGFNRDKRAAYGELKDQGEKLIRSFRDISGKHVYMSAKMGLQKDEVSGITMRSVMMPGNKLGQGIPYFFDEMYALRVGEDEGGSFRYFQTQPDLSYDAKCRSGALDLMEEAHMGNIIRKILAYAS
jgi:hypothetical protein